MDEFNSTNRSLGEDYDMFWKCLLREMNLKMKLH